MDVQQVASQPAVAVAIPQGQGAPDPGSVADVSLPGTPNGSSAPAAAQVLSPDPQDQAQPAPAAAKSEGGIAPIIAKLFGSGQPQPISLNVSYRVAHYPNEIVTVFTDPKSGQEIAQFPSELLIKLAEFFDKAQGATLDQSA